MPGPAVKLTRVDQRPDQLLGEERIAAAAFDDTLGDRACGRMIADQIPGQRRHILVMQLVEPDFVKSGAIVPRRLEARPIGEDQQDAAHGNNVDQRGDELDARLVQPVNIFDDGHGRRARSVAHQAGNQVDEPRMPCLGIERQRRRCRIGNAEEFRQNRNVVHQFGNGRLDPRSNLRTRRLGIIRGSKPEKGPEELHQRLQRPGVVVRRCPEIQHRRQPVPRDLGELEAQPALAEAGRRRDPDRLAGAALRPGEGVMQHGKLGIAPATGSDDRVAERRAGRLHSDQPVDSDRPGKSLNVLMAQRAAVAVRVHQLERRLRDADVAGLRHVLQPAGEMHGGAVNALLPREFVRQARDDLAGVNPDPERDAVFARRLHHRQRGLAGA
jgi:hypothetical protein